MDDKNTELYQTLFKEMTPVEYLKISETQWETIKTSQRIITQGIQYQICIWYTMELWM